MSEIIMAALIIGASGLISTIVAALSTRAAVGEQVREMKAMRASFDRVHSRPAP